MRINATKTTTKENAQQQQRPQPQPQLQASDGDADSSAVTTLQPSSFVLGRNITATAHGTKQRLARDFTLRNIRPSNI